MTNLTQAKFKPNGDFNAFAGNTVVANLYDNEQVMTAVFALQELYKTLPFIDKFTLTPPQSIHMTVMELLCDQNRKPEFWSKHLPLDLPIDRVSSFFGDKLSHFPLKDETITMRVTGIGRQNILLEPADEASRQRLEDIRQYISLQTGVIFPNHNSYQFHITIGYIREELTADEQVYFDAFRERAAAVLLDHLTEVSIRRIDYTTFEDMTAFVPYQGE